MIKVIAILIIGAIVITATVLAFSSYFETPVSTHETIPGYDNPEVFLKLPARSTETAWKYPDYYPTWSSTGIKRYTDHDYSRWILMGYGAAPGSAAQHAQLKKGDRVEFDTIIYSSFGVESAQGLKLIPVYDDRLFKATVSPDEILLEPNFPIFEYNWTQKVRLNIESLDIISPGRYDFKFAVISPTSPTRMWGNVTNYREGGQFTAENLYTATIIVD